MSSEMDEERAGSFRKLPLLTIREYLTRYTTRQSTVTSSFTNFDILRTNSASSRAISALPRRIPSREEHREGLLLSTALEHGARIC
jgi:hypothetical protein